MNPFPSQIMFQIFLFSSLRGEGEEGFLFPLPGFFFDFFPFEKSVARKLLSFSPRDLSPPISPNLPRRSFKLSSPVLPVLFFSQLGCHPPPPPPLLDRRPLSPSVEDLLFNGRAPPHTFTAAFAAGNISSVLIDLLFSPDILPAPFFFFFLFFVRR